MTTNVDESVGKLISLACDGVNNVTYPTHMKNHLWYHNIQPIKHKHPPTSTSSLIHAFNVNAMYELWHHRLGHLDKTITEKFHYYTKGVAVLVSNPFHVCGYCLRSKFHSRSIKRQSNANSTKQTTTRTTIQTRSQTKRTFICQHFQMDYGFVSGSDWNRKDNDGK